MAIVHNSRKHKYETFSGIYEGRTWISELDSQFSIRLIGKYTSNTTIFGYTRKFSYCITTKEKYSSIQEAESHLEQLTKKEIVKAMAKAPKSRINNSMSIDSCFVVFR